MWPRASLVLRSVTADPSRPSNAAYVATVCGEVAARVDGGMWGGQDEV